MWMFGWSEIREFIDLFVDKFLWCFGKFEFLVVVKVNKDIIFNEISFDGFLGNYGLYF